MPCTTIPDSAPNAVAKIPINKIALDEVSLKFLYHIVKIRNANRR